MLQKQSLLQINTAHFDLSCRFDVWLRLLIQNRFRIEPRKLPQVLLISAVSLLLFPFALLERMLFALPIRRTKVRKPLFILGQWRSGTTLLQNLISRDPQFGYFDPVSTDAFNNSILLRPLLKAAQKNVLPNARPMDNMQYTLNLPMEDVFALAISSDLAVVNMLVFPGNFRRYLDSAFVGSLTERDKKRWEGCYRYILQKQTFICHGKPLLLKSPDSSARAGELFRLYPDARFINIYRNPYNTVRSTINMFTLLFDQMTVQQKPSDDFIEEAVVDACARMNRQLLDDLQVIPPQQVITIKYEEFEQAPLEHLQRIYDHLGLDGFAEARPRFQAHLESLRGYQKNRFDYSQRLIRRINEKFSFYFEHYGYEMLDPDKGAN